MNNPRLLLVDDDREFATGLASRLERKGFEVSYCFSGAEALEMLDGKVFDVAVLDVRMPEMDGLTLLAEIKKARPEMEVLLLTGYASVKTGVEGMTKGAYDFLVKPTSMDVLTARINAAYDKKTAHDDLEKEKRAARFSNTKSNNPSDD